jgi:serine/threonine protein kinase
VNLYELIKQNHFKGLSTNLVRLFSIQLLDTLSLIKLNQIIHCDLKPENILLKSLDSPSIKVIDFGSACYELQQTYTYIQSRFYRSPEVLLGLRYTTAIDMWSFGCIVAELYLGLPLFPGSSEYNQLTRITESIGNIPDEMIIGSKHGHRYFNRTTTYSDSNGNIFHFTLKDIKQYSKERKKSEKSSKRYFSTYNLDELVLNYPIARKDHLSKREKEKEKKIRIHLLDFLKKVLQLNPTERLTPQEAMKHPFISGIMKKDFKSEQVDEIISLGKKLLSEHEEKEETEQEDIPYMLTGVRRKSFANKESRSSTSVSPYSRKRYGSILSPLLSPPLETKNQDPLLLQNEASLLKAQLHNSSQLRHRSRQI